MADRNTREALLRLRRVNEIEAQRALVDANHGVTRAAEVAARAGARSRDAHDKLEGARAVKAPPSAGRMAARERFLDRLRESAAQARARAKRASEALLQANADLSAAQTAMETALRAREAAESQAAALLVRAERQKARREESAQQDRFGSRNRRRK